MILHNAVYKSGLRVVPGSSSKNIHDRCKPGGRFTWIDLYEPTEEEFDCVTRELGLDPLALEFAARNYRWPGVRHYNDQTLLVVLKTVCYVDGIQTLEHGEIQVFVEADFITTVRCGKASELHNMYHSAWRREKLTGSFETLRWS